MREREMREREREREKGIVPHFPRHISDKLMEGPAGNCAHGE